MFRRGREFGIKSSAFSIDMNGVRDRKRKMVKDLQAIHIHNYQASGAELMMAEGRFVGSKTIQVQLNEGGSRLLAGERIFLNVGTHAAVPDAPGLAGAKPLTHVEALELDRIPEHLIVLGGGYSGLEFAQAMRRLGTRVTIVEQQSQPAPREDSDVKAKHWDSSSGMENIEVATGALALGVEGQSGSTVRLQIATAGGTRVIEGSGDLGNGRARCPIRRGSG